MYNILTEPLIRVNLKGERRMDASLPQVYAKLMGDEVDSFPGLRTHQRHAWHAFLAQLGALAIHKSMQKGVESVPPIDADAWHGLLRGMTGEEWPGDEPWHLVVDDIAAPAFMQPPGSLGDRLADYKPDATTPDMLDVLVTSKNHDLKMAVASDAGVDDWLFALVSLQTMAGYEGSGKYGVSRMNGGASSRPAFSLAPSLRVGAHIRRDIKVLANDFLDADAPSDVASTLLWTRAWDGDKAEALTINQLNPLYIEVCRRIRLRRSEDGEGLRTIRATSKGARIEANALNGRTGDPWTPVNRKENKSLTLSGGGFTYNRVVDYLMDAEVWELPELCKATESERGSADTMRLVARAMVRGQGKTEGYYERVIPFRHKTIQIFGRGGGAQQLGDIARERITQIGIVKGALRRGIAVFAANGNSETSDGQRVRANDWGNRLDDIVDASFFEDLQDEFEADESERGDIRNKWLRNTEDRDGVIEHAQRLLDEAGSALPCQSIYRYRARAAAESEFWRRIRGPRGLPFLFHTQDDKKEEDECQNNSEQTQEQNPTGAQLNLI